MSAIYAHRYPQSSHIYAYIMTTQSVDHQSALLLPCGYKFRIQGVGGGDDASFNGI